jgi:hypothetical protein
MPEAMSTQSATANIDLLQRNTLDTIIGQMAKFLLEKLEVKFFCLVHPPAPLWYPSGDFAPWQQDRFN